MKMESFSVGEMRRFFNQVALEHGYNPKKSSNDQRTLSSFASNCDEPTMKKFITWIFDDSPPKYKPVSTNILVSKWPEFTKWFSA